MIMKVCDIILVVILFIALVSVCAYGYRRGDDPRYTVYRGATVKPLTNGMYRITYQKTIYGEHYKQATISRVYLMAEDNKIVASVPEVINRLGPKIYYNIGEKK